MRTSQVAGRPGILICAAPVPVQGRTQARDINTRRYCYGFSYAPLLLPCQVAARPGILIRAATAPVQGRNQGRDVNTRRYCARARSQPGWTLTRAATAPVPGRRQARDINKRHYCARPRSQPGQGCEYAPLLHPSQFAGRTGILIRAATAPVQGRRQSRDINTLRYSGSQQGQGY